MISGAAALTHDHGKLALFMAHRADLIDYATSITGGDRARAEDVVQDAFLRFVPAGQADGTLDQPLGYLYRIVRNLALDWSRRRAVEVRSQDEGAPWWMLPAVPRTPEEEVTHRRTLARIVTVLNRLEPDIRIAVEMHRFGGHTLGEIAARLGVSVPTAHRMVRGALMQIAAAIGPDDAGHG
jgi:RNA polymerase sigma-70 factor (ECF subfamily)|tara:strand:+ start:1530 stop:2075 length:546 start_codon:yes stop_codon:yes gene_type:complete